jgi:hypothetical protein
MRLDVERLAAAGFPGVWDPLDLLAGSDTSIYRDANASAKRPAVIEWTPGGLGTTAFVPLALLQLFRIPDTPANHELIGRLGVAGVQVTNGVVLAARRLHVRVARGPYREVGIAGALGHPLRFAAAPA